MKLKSILISILTALGISLSYSASANRCSVGFSNKPISNETIPESGCRVTATAYEPRLLRKGKYLASQTNYDARNLEEAHDRAQGLVDELEARIERERSTSRNYKIKVEIHCSGNTL